MRVRLRGDTGTMEWSSDLGLVGTVRLGGGWDFGPPSPFRVEWGTLLTAGALSRSARAGPPWARGWSRPH